MIFKTVRVKSVKEGLTTNSYIILDEETNEVMIIDPGGEAQIFIDEVNMIDGKLKYIYLTHCHVDHIGAVKEIKNALGGTILISKGDYEGLFDKSINRSFGIEYPEIERGDINENLLLNDNDKIYLGENEFEVLSTPGHTKGCTCLYNKENKLLFSGDTIFNSTFGRTDLPTGNEDEMMKSLLEKVLLLPEDVEVFPGHGSPTNIKDEKNLYIR